MRGYMRPAQRRAPARHRSARTARAPRNRLSEQRRSAVSRPRVRYPGTPCLAVDYARLSTSDRRPSLLTIRRVILGVLILGMGGLLAELPLIAHYEDRPSGFRSCCWPLASSLLVLDLVLARGWTQLLVQLTMVLFVAAGVLGVYFHFQGAGNFSSRWIRRCVAPPWCGTCCGRSRRRHWRRARWCSWAYWASAMPI